MQALGFIIVDYKTNDAGRIRGGASAPSRESGELAVFGANGSLDALVHTLVLDPKG